MKHPVYLLDVPNPFGISDALFGGLGLLWILLWAVLGILGILVPWMIFRLHRNIKRMLKINQSIAQSLVTISQQINHYAAPAPHVPIHKAPAQRR